MKVCDLTQSYAPTGGGVRTMLHAQRDYVERHTDDEYTRIVPGPDDAVAREGRSTLHTISSPHVPGSEAYRLLLRSDKVLRILAEKRPDVVAVYCAYNLPWTALWHRRRHGCIVVGIYMTDVPTAYVEPAAARLAGERAGRAARAVAERYARTLYNRCDAAVAISPALADRLRGMGVRNVECVPLGVDLDTFQPARRDPALRERFGVAEHELLFVYAGRLDGEKRPDLVADAFERLPDAVGGALVLVGEGPLRPALERRAAGDGRIHVEHYRSSRPELARLLASADVYVSAMPHETFGLSVLEAQACGLPVVGVRSGAMVDRVPDGTGVLVPPGDPEAMARAIAAHSRDEWRALGDRAREHVAAEFSWRRTFERLFALYRRLDAR